MNSIINRATFQQYPTEETGGSQAVSSPSRDASTTPETITSRGIAHGAPTGRHGDRGGMRVRGRELSTTTVHGTVRALSVRGISLPRDQRRRGRVVPPNGRGGENRVPFNQGVLPGDGPHQGALNSSLGGALRGGGNGFPPDDQRAKGR